MYSIGSFYENLLQDVLANAETRAMQNANSFKEIITEELIETGDLPNTYLAAQYKYLTGRYPMEAVGMAYDSERQVMYLLIMEYYQEDKIETLTSKVIEQKFKRGINFIEQSLKGLYSELEETSDAFEMAFNIYDKFHKGTIDKFKLVLISDGKISRSYKGIELTNIAGKHAENLIVDIEYLFNNFQAQNADSSFAVDVVLPALKVPLNTETYDSYLAYVTGEQLYAIYDTYGKKLLEQNVRTFLQFRGGINKGIRNTLEGAPEMFFAYNNGITATASELEFNEVGEIIRIHNLQIVNGGQTTSSIYAAKKTNKIDISNVVVQMKLSVIQQGSHHGEFVAKVAEYANTQNKVNKSDFFSNSPFHKEFKLYSQKVWAPSMSQERELWFYERVRGEYLNEQAYLTNAEKRKFEALNPRNKKIDKPMLAKAEMVWLQKPDVVSKGAQESFLHFANHITEELEKNSLAITEGYFKDAISRIILFKHVEKLVSAASWYNGGFRANIVAYTISYLSYIISVQNRYLDFNLIWENQCVPNDLNQVLEIIAEEVSDHVVNPPPGSGNPSQWAKKSTCWQTLKQKAIDVQIPVEYILTKETEKTIKKEEKALKRVDKSIEAQMRIVSMDMSERQQLLAYFSKPDNRGSITYKEFSILEKFATGKLAVPSDKQALVLNDILALALSEGIVID